MVCLVGYIPEIQVWPLGSSVKLVSRYWELSLRNGNELEGWGCGAHRGRKSGCATKIYADLGNGDRGRRGHNKLSTTKMRLRLESFN